MFICGADDVSKHSLTFSVYSLHGFTCFCFLSVILCPTVITVHAAILYTLCYDVLQIYDYAWYYVMAAELTADYPLAASELPPTLTTFPATYLNAVIFQYNYVSGQVTKVEQFSENSIFTIPSCGKSDFQYYAIAPHFANIGMYLFGELHKFVPVSEQRFVDFNQSQDEVYFRLAGDPGEVVYVTYYDGSQSRTVNCEIRADYYAELTITRQGSAKCF